MGLETLVILLTAVAFVSTFLMFLAPRARLIFGMMGLVLWFPIASVVATETEVQSFYGLFLGMGLLCLLWIAVMIFQELRDRL